MSRMPSWCSSMSQRIIFAAFVALNILLVLFAVPDAPYAAAADLAVSLEPAQSLLNGTGFTHPDGSPFTWGTPLYPLFLAAFVGLLPWKAALYAIVVVQCVLLYATGLMARHLAASFLPKAATLAQILLIFNPNMLITAHLLQTDVLFAFLLTAGVLSMLKYSGDYSLRHAAVAGACIGIATLVRPAGQFVIPLLPFLLVLLGVKKGRDYFVRSLCAGALALGVAISIISPWIVRNYTLFGSPFLTTNAGMYLEAQYRQLLRNGYGMSEADTGAAAEEKANRHLAVEGIDFIALQKMTPIDRSRELAGAYLGAMLEVPVDAHAKAFAQSLAELYVAGGASNIRNYLGIEGKHAIVQFQGEGRSSLADAVNLLLTRIDYGYAVLLVVTFGYTLAMRTIGIVGLVTMFRKDMTSQTLVILAVMAVLTLSYLYLGQSRFRVPLEPYLAVMAAVGLYAVRGNADDT